MHFSQTGAPCFWSADISVQQDLATWKTIYLVTSSTFKLLLSLTQTLLPFQLKVEDPVLQSDVQWSIGQINKVFPGLSTSFTFLVLHAVEKAFFWCVSQCVCEISCHQNFVQKIGGACAQHSDNSCRCSIRINCIISSKLSFSCPAWKNLLTS